VFAEGIAVIDGVSGRSRVVIEGVSPEIDGGRFAIKRTVGERVVVEADVFGDGHDLVSAVLLYRRDGDPEWNEVALTPLVNDRWHGEFPVVDLGRYCYTVRGWVDHFKTWVHDLEKRVEAGQDVTVDLEIGALLVDEAAANAPEPDAEHLRDHAAALRTHGGATRAMSPELEFLMERHAPRHFATTYDRELAVVVDPVRARYSTWYEFFPRSAGKGTEHGSFRDAEAWLPGIAAMGFDVVYFPPIHPIGIAHRKGMNNTTTAEPSDPGSPWAIGGAEGGHKDIHPELGTLDDFKHLIGVAGDLGIQIAMDIAYQAAPDHPYATAHRAWFRERPDGTIQYAENPPKKYQDIYPFDFESNDWQAMWEELASIFLYWCEKGIRIFRVDNPHTKAFGFWEWCIAEVKRAYPDAIFLSEAFTRPKVMYRLAKLGFSQSYTYFTWRNTPWEIREYFTELTQTDVKEFFRPNLWPNTPDILPEYLQHGGRPAFITRLILAATLGASYGMYGPAFELLEHAPTAPGREEYLFSEKYEIKDWDRDRPDSLREIITIINGIRRDNPALQSNRNLRFHSIGNDQMIAYSKTTDDGSNLILTVVNTDPYNTQSGWLELPLDDLGIDESQPYQVHDLLGGGRYLWHGAHNFVQLDPHAVPGHIFVIRRRVRTERDFDYFM
jgi:starch synthase (maltosyl-transferring)